MDKCSIRDKEMTMINDAARSSLIKLICFDLDGVYFDGDFHDDFLYPVNKRTGANIEIGNDQKIVLDKDLNLGNISIVQWVEKNIGHELANDDRTFIISKWKSVWKPNAKMQELAERLNNEGYATGVFSNVDSLNGEMYKGKGYFSLFPAKYQFLSYELRMTKPDTKFYEEMLKRSKLSMSEILIIDDQDSNIVTARDQGMFAIKYSNKTKIEILCKELKDIGVGVDL